MGFQELKDTFDVRWIFFDYGGLLAAIPIASHAGVFSGVRLSSEGRKTSSPKNEWEATIPKD